MCVRFVLSIVQDKQEKRLASPVKTGKTKSARNGKTQNVSFEPALKKEYRRRNSLKKTLLDSRHPFYISIFMFVFLIILRKKLQINARKEITGGKK